MHIYEYVLNRESKEDRWRLEFNVKIDNMKYLVDSLINE